MPFVDELEKSGTHGLLDLSTCTVHSSSRSSDWRSLYVSYQTERPFQHAAPRKPHGLLVMHINGPVEVASRFQGRARSSMVPGGAITFWPPGHDFEVEVYKKLQTVHAYLDPSVIRDTAAQFGLNDFQTEEMAPIFAETDDLLHALLIEALKSAAESRPHGALYAEQLAQAIAARLIYRRLPLGRRPVGITASALSPAQMKRLTDHVVQRVEAGVSIKELADLVGYSPSHFTRAFKLTTGTSPYQFVMTTRIEESKRLLQFTGERIADIALDCGFANQEHFSRTFRKLVGTTPLGFRKASRM